jgi:protein ImuB
MFACIHIPDFAVQAAVRVEPELSSRALALLEGDPPLCRVVAASAAALAAGIEIGMSKAQAEQFAGVELRRRQPEQERNAHAALLDLGGSFSPHVEDTAPGTILLDLAGLETLLGDAANAARQMARSAKDVCGLAAHVAVAANPETALHAARGFAGITVIAEGEEAARLGLLPIRALGASEEALETLERWGIRNCAALAALPVLELSERLGAEGVQLHQWARGAGRRALVLAEPAICFEESLELDYEVTELEPLAFLLSRLLEALCARLEARSLTASAIRLRLKLARSKQTRAKNETAGGIPRPARSSGAQKERCARNDELSQFVRCLQLPVPVRNAKLLLNLLRLQLQGDPPGAPVCGLFLAAEPARPRATQSGFFVPSGPDPEKLELTLAKLSHVVGEARVGSPELADTHRPDAFRMRRFAATPLEKSSTTDPTQPEHRTGPPQQAGFRMFRPGLAARVEMHAGQPARVFFHGLRGEVVTASGPWRSSGEWWEKSSWRQEEWDLEIRFVLSGNELRRGLYRLTHDEIRGEWLVRGAYD